MSFRLREGLDELDVDATALDEGVDVFLINEGREPPPAQKPMAAFLLVSIRPSLSASSNTAAEASKGMPG